MLSKLSAIWNLCFVELFQLFSTLKNPLRFQNTSSTGSSTGRELEDCRHKIVGWRKRKWEMQMLDTARNSIYTFSQKFQTHLLSWFLPLLYDLPSHLDSTQPPSLYSSFLLHFLLDQDLRRFQLANWLEELLWLVRTCLGIDNLRLLEKDRSNLYSLVPPSILSSRSSNSSLGDQSFSTSSQRKILEGFHRGSGERECSGKDEWNDAFRRELSSLFDLQHELEWGDSSHPEYLQSDDRKDEHHIAWPERGKRESSIKVSPRLAGGLVDNFSQLTKRIHPIPQISSFEREVGPEWVKEIVTRTKFHLWLSTHLQGIVTFSSDSNHEGFRG